MSDKLDDFLKKNAPRVPAAPPGEKAAIWRAIEAGMLPSRASWRDWLALPQLRYALPALAVAAIVLGTIQIKKARHDREVERVLMSALSYQLDDSGDDGVF
jgi:hypothetical protein